MEEPQGPRSEFQTPLLAGASLLNDPRGEVTEQLILHTVRLPLCQPGYRQRGLIF